MFCLCAEDCQITMRPSSVVVINLSLFLNPFTNHLQIWDRHAFWNAKEAILIFKFVMTFFSSILLTWEHMKVKISKRYSSYSFLLDWFQFIFASTLGGPSQNVFLRILNFKKKVIFFKFKYMGLDISKRYSC